MTQQGVPKKRPFQNGIQRVTLVTGVMYKGRRHKYDIKFLWLLRSDELEFLGGELVMARRVGWGGRLWLPGILLPDVGWPNSEDVTTRNPQFHLWSQKAMPRQRQG